MNVKLLAHTQVTHEFRQVLDNIAFERRIDISDGQAVALTAIRTCYSPIKPSEIIAKEGAKYFGNKAADGGKGSDADRLFRMIVHSGHLSTMEHLSFTFAIEGVSRALLAQLTRHRVGFSFSVQSQRYVRLGSGDKSGGADHVIPPSANGKYTQYNGGMTGEDVFKYAQESAQAHYDVLREMGVPPEDARMVLPNATVTNLVMTANLRSLLDFYAKRRKGRGAQWEIADLAEELRKSVVDVEPWTAQFFEGV